MNKLWAIVTSVVKSVVTLIIGGPTSAFRVPPPPQTHRKEFAVEVVRPDDLLVLTLDFYNIRLVAAGGTAKDIERIGAGDGFVVAHFPPQSFGEQAFFETESGASPPSDPLLGPPVTSRIAGPSRLVFRVAPALLPCPFTLESILATLTNCAQVVQETTHFPLDTPAIGGLTTFGGTRSQFSAIEAPYRLIMSPDFLSRWQHATLPVTDAAKKRIELWHTRLSPDSTAAAVWSPDYNGKGAAAVPANDDLPFRTSLRRKYRHEIVVSTSQDDLVGAHAVDVEQFMLTSQGAWLSVHGEWRPDLTGLDLVEWRHIMTGGRDQYARIVEAGYLFPLGHRAVIVTITERKVQMGKSGLVEGKPVAYLRQQKKIFVRQPTKNYQHRDEPFRRATLKTLATQSLDLPSDSQILTFGEDAFWPKVNGKDVLFHVVATDWDKKREIEFYTPLAFVIKSLADNPNHTKINQVITQFNGLPLNDFLRERSFGGQKISYAPRKTSTDDTTFETARMVFGACAGTASPFFLPTMVTADVDIPAVRQITGKSAPSTIKYRDDYVQTVGNVEIGNMGEVFAELVGTRTAVSFSSDKTGGAVAPNFAISGLSRGNGPIGGEANTFAAGDFKPAEIFKNVKIFGGIEFGSIILDAINLIPGSPKIPKLKTIQTKATINGIVKDVLQTTYAWDVGAEGLIPAVPPPPFMFTWDAGAHLLIESVVNVPVDGTTPSTKVHGKLDKFHVSLLPATPLVALHFTSLEFVAEQNAKVDFAIVFDHFEFLGVLGFVNKLLDVIPMDGFNDPPFLELILPPKPEPGVKVGFTQGVPTVGIGIFTLQNIGFSASFYLPFLAGEAVMRLAFCERHQPFTLTVMLFGGGGFFAIEIGMSGVKWMEASLEFGASVALDLGVASGMACIMGGVYYGGGPAGFQLTAYFRAAGALTVLGFITVSVELYVSLNYASKGMGKYGGKLWGQASVSVKVKIAFFSVSVSISIERVFAGSDPKFIDSVSSADWIDYCNSFADCPV